MSPSHPQVQSFDLVIFGGTGDLAARKLLPAMFHRFIDGQIPADSRIIGIAREATDDAGYRAQMRKALAGDGSKADQVEAFLQQVFYRSLDARKDNGWDDFAALLAERPNNVRVFYLSTAPDLFIDICTRLGHYRLNEGESRVVLEKPIGRDLESANQINDAVGRVFSESQTYRIDHYLGKETVQNLLALRFGNALFEPLWNAEHIDHVQITVAETLGVGNRAAYYDHAGALRDMVQNHMLQLVCMVAMEPPSSLSPDAVRDEKLKVLRSLRPVAGADVPNLTVTGQYGGGAVKGEIVRSYDTDLEKPSDTETFVAIKAHVDNWRWHGVPFYLRTGKRLAERRSEIVIQFKPVPHSIFADRGGALQPNILVIRLQPEEYIQLRVMAKQPGLDREGIRLKEVPLNLSLEHEFAGTRRRIAYERLFLDLIEGDPTLFVRRDEVEAQWEWIDAIREGWKAGGVKPRPYASGSWGPSAAIALTERDGVTWNE